MNKIIFLILLLPSLVSAEHHRTHAANHLIKTAGYLESAAIKLQQYSDAIDYSSVSEADSVAKYIRQAKARINELRVTNSRALEKLQDPSTVPENLETIRLLLNSPNSKAGMGYQFESTANKLRSVSLHFRVEPFDKSSAVIYLLLHAWREWGAAVWHVTDAIREEVYLDPVFICSGPGNHCE